MSESGTTEFDSLREVATESPTLIEGLPGLGLVASITADQITRQLDLDYHGQITCAELPPVVSYEDGRVRDPVRVYAGKDPAVLTLQSDMPIPEEAFDELGACVLNDLVDEFDRAIFLAGAPAQSEEELGDVSGIATTETIEGELTDAGIDLAEGSGLVGGVTGALIDECYRNDVPAAGLIVKANPHIPDPGAARTVVENALEPLLEFDIDTAELQEQADSIRERLEQVAEQYQQQAEAQSQPQTPNASMYQ